MKYKLIVLFISCSVLSAFISVNTTGFYVPQNWPKPHYDFSKNQLTTAKLALGRALFYDPILSRDSTISCNSCHSQYTAFAHVDHALSHGIDSRIGTRNSPILVNLAWQNDYMWDGTISHLDEQPLKPIGNRAEMDSKITDVIAKLRNSKNYRTLFYNAYGDSTCTEEKTLKSMSAFMLSIVSANSKYDSVMRNEAVFTRQEKNGYDLFKKNCSTCHSEPLFTTNGFENNGLKVDSSLNDLGRMSATANEKDFMMFKVPSLRNIEFSAPYMHDGRFRKLSDVLKHYTSGMQESKSLSKQLKTSIVLTSNERVDVISFLLTLTDKSFLFNPKYSDPKTISITNN